MVQYLRNTRPVLLRYMPYTTNPHAPKVRKDAVHHVVQEGWSIRKTARHFGVQPSTVSRWVKKDPTGGFWRIPTRSSRPKTSPRALPKETIDAILTEHIKSRRCGQVVHAQLKRNGTEVSLSSVQRVLSRTNLLKKRSPWKRPHDATPRPEAAYPGALVELDTIHFVLADGSRLYIYTLIDLFSRFAYAQAVPKIGAKPSVSFLRKARRAAPFSFGTVQTDNGPEFSTWFTHECVRLGISHRHSRVRRSNDNAHIERFNRTVQEECLDRTAHTLEDFGTALKEYLPEYNGSRLHMGLDFQTPLEVLRRC